MSELSLKSFMKRPAEKIVDFPGVGQVKMSDVGLEQQESLKKFYDQNYYEGYILSNPELFAWMFKNNGGRVASLSLNGEIIAHQGHVPIVFTDGHNDYPGFISASTMVSADFRRKGLMSFLRGSVQDRYEMAASLGGSAMGVQLYTAMGYKYYGELIRNIAIVNPEKCQDIAQNPEVLKRTVKLSDEDNASVKPIENFSAISSELNELRREVFKAGQYFGVKRDAEFLDWRYAEHPIFKYHRFGLWQDGSLSAIIVFRFEQPAGSEVSVIRMVEAFGRPGSLAELVSSTVLSVKEAAEVAWIDFLCSNKKISQELFSCGFVQPEDLLPAVVPILCQPIDYNKTKFPFMFWSKDENRHQQLPPLEDWYVTKGDGDADRPNKVEGYVKP